MDNSVVLTGMDSHQENELDDLLSEDAARALERAQSTFDNIASHRDQPLVLFGAGGLGKKTLNGLRKLGIEPLAFSDNNPAFWNTSLEGITVLSPQDATQRFGQSATFVVTIWGAGGSHRFVHSRQQLNSLGCRSVVSFATLFWKYADLFLPYYGLDLPHRVIQAHDQVRQAFMLWDDEDSKLEYITQLKWRLWLDFDRFSSPVTHEQYFAGDLFSLIPKEVFVDCGAFDGDSLKSFLRHSREKFARYIGLEPDPVLYQELAQYVSSLDSALRDKMELHQLAASIEAGSLWFQASGTASASVVQSGGIKVKGLPLDNILANLQPSFIKMDIEGSELDALAGARETIKRTHPILAISVYHQQNHLWKIPLFINSLYDEYKFFLRPHDLEGWDLVCYAIPPDRLKGCPKTGD